MHKTPSVLFGHGALPVNLPASCRTFVVGKPPMPALPDPARAVADALLAPVGDDALPLPDLARGARSACILICDVTRPVPNGLLLPPLVDTLLAAGVDAQNIVVLVATGLHRPNLGAELRTLVGNDHVMDTVRIENHEAEDAPAHIRVGVTSRGTPVALDRRFVEADLKIVTGLVEPHFMAGYSGGRKVIAPGVAYADTIRTFHNTRFMEDAAARNCRLDGNPLHAEQMEILAMLGPTYAVNTCLDDARRPAFVNFGEVAASHAEAVAFMRRFAEVPMEKKYRCVITSAAGHPLDLTYYQAVKGMGGALGALDKGGSLLIAAECAEGFGSAAFRAAQDTLVSKGIDGFLAEARQRPLANIDEWQTVKLIEALRDYRVHLYATGLDAEARRLTGVTCHDDWDAALAAVLAESGAEEVAIIPEGPYVIPV